MLHEWARVLEVGENFAWVAPDANNGCAGCKAQTGCGAQLLAGFLRGRSRRLLVVNDIGARVGDHVEIAVARSVLLRAAFAAYMLPLLAMISAAFCAEAMIPVGGEWRELWVSTLALGGLGVSLWLVGRWFGDADMRARLQPIVVKHLHRPSTGSTNRIYSGEN